MKFQVVLDYGEHGGEVLFNASEKAFFKVSRILLKDARRRCEFCGEPDHREDSECPAWNYEGTDANPALRRRS